MVYFYKMISNKGYKSLIWLVLVTTPIIAILNVMPPLFMEKVDVFKLPFSYFLISILILIIWGINIGLLKLLKKPYLKNKKLMRFIMSNILVIVVTYFVFRILKNNIGLSETPQMVTSIMKINSNTFFSLFPIFKGISTNFIILILIELHLLQKSKFEIEGENVLLKLANLEAKNTQLKQQLYPHFLFNTLNTLKVLIGRDTKEAINYLKQITFLLRYSTKNENIQYVSLKEELMLCNSYLLMQKIRFGEALDYSIKIEEGYMNKKIPTFSLQLLTENAIKHNVLTIKCPLFISIEVEDENLVIKNSYQPKDIKKNSSGIGLKNLKERYELLGERIPQFSINNNQYTVTLNFIAYANCDN